MGNSEWTRELLRVIASWAERNLDFSDEKSAGSSIFVASIQLLQGRYWQYVGCSQYMGDWRPCPKILLNYSHFRTRNGTTLAIIFCTHSLLFP